jgi:hypothetical protein
MTPAPVSAEELLRFFAAIDRNDEGYSLCRLRGWATRMDVDEETMKLGSAEELQQLVRHKLLTRVDVRLPGASTPVWAYRITHVGAQRVAPGYVVAPLPTAPWKTDVRPYLPPGVRIALGVLKHVAQAAQLGEAAWRTSRQLSAVLAATDKLKRRGTYFDAEDLRWAVRHKVFDRQIGHRGSEYRVSTFGAGLQYLIWAGPQPGSGKRRLQ